CGPPCQPSWASGGRLVRRHPSSGGWQLLAMRVVLEVAVVLGSALVAALVFTPAARALARRVGAVTRPMPKRWYKGPTPLFGGGGGGGAGVCFPGGGVRVSGGVGACRGRVVARRRLAGIPALQLPPSLGFHGRRRQPVPWLHARGPRRHLARRGVHQPGLGAV